jgi:hypothetical protein
MESAFKTFVSAAGLMAACYILTVAHWTQVLMLFFAASLGWSAYLSSYRSQRKPAAPGQLRQRQQPAEAQAASPDVAAPTRVAPAPVPPAAPSVPVYRFPIHKLTGVSPS